MAEEYTPLSFTERSILNLPDEVLTQIISLLTHRERVPLGNSCRRLKTLVFEERKMLKYLDFSKKPGLTKMSHIQVYFNNEDACQYILRVDARNVDCIKAGDLLNNSIGRAINLVEVNIHGTKFEEICQLGSFLKPLRHLQKLFIDWPETTGDDVRLCRRILQKPFIKLTYLSVRFETSILTTFTRILSLCQELEELYMDSMKWNRIDTTITNFWDSRIKEMKNLKIVHYQGVYAVRMKEELATVLPNPKKWTDFQLFGYTILDPQEFYIEKDVEVCEELLRSERLQDILNTAPWLNFKLKWALRNPACLLKEVVRITHEDAPEDWCCLSKIPPERRNSLKIDETKLLLKDPKYQISRLRLYHELERDCDAHLLGSAFSNLSELSLSTVRKKLKEVPKDSHLPRRLRKRDSPALEEQDDSPNVDSSFQLLVENTPNLRHFTLDPKGWTKINDWDLDALHLISGWRNLETLHLTDVSCEDAKFLIEIGKNCKNLQKLFLYNQWCKETDQVSLFNMLAYCHNLRDFTIEGWRVDHAEMFSLLAKNAKLVRVEAKEKKTYRSTAPWVSSMENMVRQCTKLTTIICGRTHFETEDDLNEAVSAIKRIEAEFRRRPDFEMEVFCFTAKPKFRHGHVGRVIEDWPTKEHFPVDFIQY